MDRRTFLAGVTGGAALLAGCNVGGQGPTSTPTDGDGPPAGTPTPTDPAGTGNDDLFGAAIVDLETADRTYAVPRTDYHTDDGGRVAMRFTGTATADHPARVRATLTNANPFSNTFRLEWTPPFGRLTSDLPYPMGRRPVGEYSYRASLVFAPTSNHELVDAAPAVHRDADGLWRLAADDGATEWLPERVALDAGETVTGEYALVGHPDGAGRGRPPGVYEFSRAEEPPVRVTVWRTSAPGPAGESTFSGATLPPLPGDGDVAWFHDADATTPSFVRPSAERTDLPAAVRFTFLNRAREGTGCGHWGLYKLDGGEWFHLGPFMHTAECRGVAPGETASWTVRAASGELAPCEGAAHFPFLGGGRYAAVGGYGHATAESAALVAIDAPPVEVVPTRDVTTERDGATLTATSDRWRRAPDEQGAERAKLVLEGADAADRRLIAEEVMRERFRGYRNTLAFAGPDVDTVVLRTDDRVVSRSVGGDGTPRTVRFDGTAYTVSARRSSR